MEKEAENSNEKDPLEKRLTRILETYGRLMKKAEIKGCSLYSSGELCARAEKARLNVIGCMLNKGVLSYSSTGNYEIRYFKDIRLDTKILDGPEGRLYATKAGYAQKFRDFIVTFIYPESAQAIDYAPAV